jgi:hypothetical protein
VRSAIQRIAVEHRRLHGYRGISAELRRWGMQAHRKGVMRIMAKRQPAGGVAEVLRDDYSTEWRAKRVRSWFLVKKTLSCAFECRDSRGTIVF